MPRYPQRHPISVSAIVEPAQSQEGKFPLHVNPHRTWIDTGDAYTCPMGALGTHQYSVTNLGNVEVFVLLVSVSVLNVSTNLQNELRTQCGPSTPHIWLPTILNRVSAFPSNHDRL